MSNLVDLPIIDRPLDNTAMTAYMACAREYYLAMMLHRRGSGRSASLAYGGVMHILFGAHYRSGGVVELAEALAEGWWAQNGHQDEGDHRTLKRAILDYKRYREKWGQKPELEQGTTIGWPDSPMVEIPFDIHANELSWAGKIDRVIELGGLYYVEDHKTTSRLDSNFYKTLQMSNQMMGYVWAAQQLMPAVKIVGVRINTIHILKEKTGFERQLITYTKEQINEWVRNTLQWITRLRQDMAIWPSEERLLKGEANHEWPLAHFGDNGCSRKYGLCQYYELCRVADPFRHKKLLEFEVNPWNPLQED